MYGTQSIPLSKINLLSSKAPNAFLFTSSLYGSECELVDQDVGMTFHVPEHVDHGAVSVSGDVSPAPRG